jgi:CheY-like chemotaxis protein
MFGSNVAPVVAAPVGKGRRLARPPRGRARVLVVDDDLACRILAALVLEKDGHQPTAVASVIRALERLDSEGADLVLTDLMMPGRDGIDLLESLAARSFAAPVIAMTGSGDDGLVRRALELGAQTVLHKPFELELLRAAVRTALGYGNTRGGYAA